MKLFTNERKEADRFDSYLKRIQELSISTTMAIALLNFGKTGQPALVLFCFILYNIVESRY